MLGDGRDELVLGLELGMVDLVEVKVLLQRRDLRSGAVNECPQHWGRPRAWPSPVLWTLVDRAAPQIPSLQKYLNFHQIDHSQFQTKDELIAAITKHFAALVRLLLAPAPASTSSPTPPCSCSRRLRTRTQSPRS